MVSQERHGTVFQYWISFWPVAPFFGVNWRFEKLMPAAGFFRPGQVAADMAKAGAAEAARATTEAVETFSAQVEAAQHAAVEVVESLSAQVEAVAHLTDLAPTSAVEAAGPASERPELLYAERPVDADDLKVIRGVGPKLEAMLNDMGVYRLSQIAGFSEANLAWIDENLTAFRGRPLRDDWVSQAKALL